MQPDTRDKTREALEILARTFGDALKRFFQRRIAQQPDADDLVQETLLHLLRRGDIEHIEHIKPYVFLTASNVLRDRHRRRAITHADHHEPIEETAADLSAFEASAFSPERVLQGKEALQRLMAALDELPELTQQVFLLHFRDGHTQVRVAEDVGISARSVRNHLTRALAHLAARRREDW